MRATKNRHPHRQTFAGQRQGLTAEQKQLVEWMHQGNRLMETEQFQEASEMYAKILDKQPSNVLALNNLGASLVKLGRTHEAQVVLEYVLELDPSDAYARLNLGAIYQANKDFRGGLQNALDAVAAAPTSPIAFNNLGCAFGSVNMLEEGLHAYQTAQLLDPNHWESALNVAMTLKELGRDKEALDAYQELLERIPEHKAQFKHVVKFFASFLYLELGDLETGWAYYASGFNPSIPTGAARSPRREFPCPQWQGEDLSGKKLIIWREQGIGDEILFSSCMVDLMDTDASITFECSERLLSTYQRSFPRFQVRPEFAAVSHTGAAIEGYDFHVPVAALPGLLRKTHQDFLKQRPFIKVNFDHVFDLQERLKPFEGNKLVGICWRSGLMDPLRNKEYSSLDDWGDILTMPGCTFVNLQYGDCEAELQQAESRFGVQIVRWPDLDLKNELDRVFSLIYLMDAVISAPTAVNCMAGAVGVKTLYLGNQKSWTTLGQTDRYPWYPNTLVCGRSTDASAAQALTRVPEILRAL